MKLDLSSGDRVRVSTNSNRAFFDSESEQGEMCLGVDFYGMHYLEMREKSGDFRMFVFPNKEYSESFVFGYWANANIVWSYSR